MTGSEPKSLSKALFQREILLNQFTITLVHKTYQENFDQYDFKSYLKVCNARDHLRDTNEAIFEFLEQEESSSKMRFFIVYGMVSILSLQVNAIETLATALNLMYVNKAKVNNAEANYQQHLQQKYPQFSRLSEELSEYRQLLFHQPDMNLSTDIAEAKNHFTQNNEINLEKTLAVKRSDLLTELHINTMIHGWLIVSNAVLEDMVAFFEQIKFG